jgi:hypothetical protein
LKSWEQGEEIRVTRDKREGEGRLEGGDEGGLERRWEKGRMEKGVRRHTRERGREEGGRMGEVQKSLLSYPVTSVAGRTD